MLKANKRTLIVASVVTLLPILIGIYFWQQLPDVMATHVGTDSQANGYSSKAVAVFGFPLLCLAVLWIGAVVTANDPRKQNISPKLFTLGLWIAPLVSWLAAATIYYTNLGRAADVSFIGGLFMGALLIVIGNYLPKARQNYTIGIKLAWTLANEENWNRTHRMAGVLWIVGGVLLIALTLCRASSGWFVAVVAAIAVIPCGYSFWLHAKKSL